MVDPILITTIGNFLYTLFGWKTNGESYDLKKGGLTVLAGIIVGVLAYYGGIETNTASQIVLGIFTSIGATRVTSKTIETLA